MGSEWKSLQLGDICELRAGSVFPPALQGKLTGTYPFVKVSDMNLPANALYIQVANNWINDTEMVKLKAKPFPVEQLYLQRLVRHSKQIDYVSSFNLLSLTIT